MAVFADLSPEARNELWAVLALRHAEGVGALRSRRLLAAFGSALAAAEQGLANPAAWKGLTPPAAARAFASGSWRASAKREWDMLRRDEFIFLLHTDEAFPESLKTLDDAPLLLYCRGDLSLLRGPAVAVVGARECTRDGIALTAYIARDLSQAGVTVISGMAKGIDRAAHLAAMEGPGRSVAVLGTGVDVPYPPCNSDIYGLLVERGLALSEFAPGVTARPAHFPVRNRIISGLAQGVLVVQAAGRSGSLITARLALEQNRSVFAAPGHPFSAESAGCHELIRRGAIPVFKADDILADLAPLLTLEARKALEKRRVDEAARKKAPARDPRKEPHSEALLEARTLLPEGALPWTAPAVLSKKQSAPAVPSQNRTSPAVSSEKKMTPAACPEKKTSPDVSRKKGASPSGPGMDLPLPAFPENAPAAGASPASLAPPSVADPGDQALLDALAGGPAHIDTLCRDLGREVAGLSARLTLLEVRGLVRREPGMYYRLPG